MRISIFLLVLFGSSYLFAQDITLSGYVRDAVSGETLIGATVVVDELKTGTNSNAYGFYSLSIPPGSYTFRVSYLGYTTLEQNLELSEDEVFNFELDEKVVELEEVIISSEAADRNVTSLEMSVNQLNIQTIRKMPSLLGEVEIIRSIQLLPGVSTVGEGAAGFNVRGGSIDQNLILLDEAPVYNSAHLFGFFSVFNPDAVKDVKLFKGGMPARYGGRLSSILDVRMKEGSSRRFEMNGGIGLIFSRLSIEAPIIKDKASFIIAGRRSYADILAQPFLNDEFEGSALNFYDLTAKANYQIDDKNQVFVSGYFGRDNFRFGSVGGFEWGNQTGTIRWNHLFSQKLFSNLTLYYSNYDYQINFEEEDEANQNSFDWRAEITNFGVKPEFSYFINPRNIIRFGGQVIVYEFEPGTAVGISEGEISDISIDDKYSIESSVYIENELNPSSRFSINYGLRLSHFNYTGEGIAYTYGESEPGIRPSIIDEETFDQWESIETYLNLEPRLSLKYQLNEKSSLKASFARTAQYIHLISNTTASVPIDVWTPSTNNIRPQTANQGAVGYFRNFADNAYEFSVEAYYKQMDNIVDYIDGADLVLNEFLEGEILPGEGRAYGLEFYLEKKKGKATGWVSYTLSRSELQVEGINEGEWYPNRFDQTHSLSIVGFYKLSKRWSFGANFALNSGTPVTFPTSRFEQQGYIIPHNAEEGRNNVRLPAYHRLDLSATLEGKEKPDKRWKGQWVFSVYNAYNRRNPFSIFFRQQEQRIPMGNPVMTEAVRLSVIGSFIPSVSYNFTF